MSPVHRQNRISLAGTLFTFAMKKFNFLVFLTNHFPHALAAKITAAAAATTVISSSYFPVICVCYAVSFSSLEELFLITTITSATAPTSSLLPCSLVSSFRDPGVFSYAKHFKVTLFNLPLPASSPHTDLSDDHSPTSPFHTKFSTMFVANISTF